MRVGGETAYAEATAQAGVAVLQVFGMLTPTSLRALGCSVRAWVSARLPLPLLLVLDYSAATMALSAADLFYLTHEGYALSPPRTGRVAVVASPEVMRTMREWAWMMAQIGIRRPVFPTVELAAVWAAGREQSAWVAAAASCRDGPRGRAPLL